MKSTQAVLLTYSTIRFRLGTICQRRTLTTIGIPVRVLMTLCLIEKLQTQPSQGILLRITFLGLGAVLKNLGLTPMFLKEVFYFTVVLVGMITCSFVCLAVPTSGEQDEKDPGLGMRSISWRDAEYLVFYFVNNNHGIVQLGPTYTRACNSLPLSPVKQLDL